MDAPQNEVNVLKPRSVHQHPNTPWRKVKTPLGSLEDAVKMFGAVTLENWTKGHKGIIGHRGYPHTSEDGKIFPESTEGAFVLSINVGIGTMETDAAPIDQDEEVRLFHDLTGKRWTEQDAPVERMDFSRPVPYVLRRNDLKAGTLGEIVITSDQFVLTLKDLVRIGKKAQEDARDRGQDLTVRWLIDCRNTSAPFTIRDVMRLTKSERNFFYIQLLNFGIKGYQDLSGQVAHLSVAEGWEDLKYVLSPNFDGLHIVAGVAQIDLSPDKHLEANKMWVEDLANNLNVYGLHAPRTGAADDWENGGGPFDVTTLSVEDLLPYHKDRITKGLQDHWRVIKPSLPLISPSAVPTITKDGKHYVSTWADPTILKELDPDHSPKDYYGLQLSDAAKHVIKWHADFVLTDHIPQTAYDLSFHVADLGMTEYYKSLIEPSY
jgi:hypothetical protein